MAEKSRPIVRQDMERMLERSRRKASDNGLERNGTEKLKLTLSGSTVSSVSAPLVSFILVNWNYGRYVGATIDSIIRQTYSHFECLVVDNGSTDESVEIIRRHIGDDARFRVLRLDENIGQLGAALIALDEINGQFVTIVDADDELFPDFASIHVQVHLASKRSVGITSSNVCEVDGAGTALTSSYHMIDIHQEHARKGLRAGSTVLRLATVSDEAFAELDRLTAFVPSRIKGWLWSPGTGNMMRRSIAELMKFKPEQRKVMRAADAHFLPLCHAFAGTALIDIPLSTYRIHGQNYFASRESITGIRSGTAEFVEKSKLDMYQSIDHLLKNAGHNSWLLADDFWRVIDQATWRNSSELQDFYRTPLGIDIFLRNAPALRQAVGDRVFVRNVFARFGFRLGRRIVATGFGGQIPLQAWLQGLRIAMSRRRSRALLH